MSAAQLLLAVLASDLTPAQRDAFIDHVVMERTADDVAREYGCSRAAVSFAAKGARRKMQRLVREQMAA